MRSLILLCASVGLTSFANASDILSKLEEAKRNCSDLQGRAHFDWRTKGESVAQSSNPYEVSFAIADGNERLSYIDADGRETSTSVEAGREHFMYKPNGEGGQVRLVLYAKPTLPYHPALYGLRVRNHWYADLLRSGSIHVVRESPESVEVEGKTPEGSHIRAWLNPSAGYLATRAEFHNEAANSKSVFTVTEWKRVGDSVFPIRGSATHSELGGKQIHSVDLVVRHLSAGKVAYEVFQRPSLPPGSEIKDEVVGRSWEIGPLGERIDRGAIGPSIPETKNQPLAGWSFVLATGACLSFASVTLRSKFASMPRPQRGKK